MTKFHVDKITNCYTQKREERAKGVCTSSNYGDNTVEEKFFSLEKLHVRN